MRVYLVTGCVICGFGVCVQWIFADTIAPDGDIEDNLEVTVVVWAQRTLPLCSPE